MNQVWLYKLLLSNKFHYIFERMLVDWLSQPMEYVSLREHLMLFVVTQPLQVGLYLCLDLCLQSVSRLIVEGVVGLMIGWRG
jgi:hypothetical protein